jgi:hypothetical protein
LDESDDAVHGDLLNDSFWLHREAPASAPLVHMSTTKRAEIILFGEDAYLRPSFAILANEFTVTAGEGDDRCTISRVTLKHGSSKRQCSLKLEDVLHTMASMGGTYPDVVEMMRRVNYLQCLSCSIAVDALPQATSIYDLARAGRSGSDTVTIHPEIAAAKADFLATPTLFEKSAGKPSAEVSDKADEDAFEQAQPKPEPKRDLRHETTFGGKAKAF